MQMLPRINHKRPLIDKNGVRVLSRTPFLHLRVSAIYV